MKSIVRYGYKFLLVAVLGLTFACGNVETGDDSGETNREDPKTEKQDETGDGFTREAEDGSQDAEVGPSPGADRTNTDSTHVTPRMQRKQ